MILTTFHDPMYVSHEAAIARAMDSARRIDPCREWTYHATYYPSKDVMIVELWGEPNR
jgi:hypothetical protein